MQRLRHFFALFVIFCGLLIPTARAGQHMGITFSATTIGAKAQAYKSIPVRILLGTSRPFSGTIIIGMKQNYPSETRIPVNTGSGSFKYEVPFLLPDCSYLYGRQICLVTLLDHRSRIVDEIEIPLDFTASAYRQSNAGWLNGPKDSAPHEDGQSMSISRLEPGDLPSDPSLYAGFDFMVIPSKTPAISAPQIDALLTWVRNGGHLVIDSSAAARDPTLNPLLGKVGITTSSSCLTTSLTYVACMPERYSYGPLTNHTATLTLALRRIEAAGAECSTDTNKLRADLPLGLGTITLTSVDLDAFISANGTTRLAEQYLFELFEGRAVIRPQTDDYRYYHGRYQGPIPVWCLQLFHMTELEPIPFTQIILYLLVFVILVCPVQRYVLRRLGRLTWTWPVTAVLVLCFCLGASFISYTARGTKCRRAILAVHDYTAQSLGRHIMFDCFIPSTSKSFDAHPARGDALFDVATQNSGSRVLCLPMRGVVNFSSPVWSPHFLTTTRTHNDPAPFSTALTFTNGIPSGYIEELQTKVNFSEVRLVTGKKAYTLTQSGMKWMVDPKRVEIIPDMTNRTYEAYDYVRETDAGVINGGQPPRKVLTSALLETRRAEGSLYFHPAKADPLSDTYIFAVASAGTILDIDEPDARIKAVHLVRQTVSSSAGKSDKDTYNEQ